MALDKKPVACKFDDFEEAISMSTRNNDLTGRNCTAAVHRGSLTFMVSELIIEELSVASTGIYELKTVDVWAVLMTFKTRSVLSISK